MNSYVIDSSAFLAVAFQELRADFVLPRLRGSLLSVVNYQEVLEKMQERQVSTEHALAGIEAMRIHIVDYSIRQAELAMAMKPVYKPLNISLADRACLALGKERDLPVLTADRSWASIDVGVRVELIR
jgi:ribonuclease VapC